MSWAARERLGALLAAIDARAADRRERAAGYDRGPLVACLVAALALVLMEYANEQALLSGLYRRFPALYDPRFASLLQLAAWISVRLVGFFALPALAIRLLLRERIRDHGLRFGGLGGYARSYVGLFALALPAIGIAASRPEFTAYYPFYKFAGASWFDFAAWELLYALQFVALEFFFRGFWLNACLRSFGSHAVFVSLAPYCMIHFTKPLLEVLAAIPAGLALGLLALRCGSIWGGAILHIAAALTMDALALLQTSGFPRRLWP